MKKIISLALVCVMMLGMLSMVSFAEETKLKIYPAFGGFENWPGSPNKGDAASVTQILVGATAENDSAIPALFTTEAEWTIKLSWPGGTKTIKLKPGTTAQAYNLIRFEPCIATGDNQFIPEKNQRYTIELSTTIDGVTYKGTSGKFAFVCPMYPMVNGAEDTTKEFKPTYPLTATLGEYHTGDDANYKSDWETWQEKETLILMFRGDSVYASDFVEGRKIVLTIDGTDYETKLPASPTYVFSADNVLVRITTEGVFTPTEGSKYSVSAKVVADDGSVLYTTNTIDTVTYGEVAKPAVDPDQPDDPVEPPKNGDATVFAVAFAVVAMFGMAVVVTKKVNA